GSKSKKASHVGIYLQNGSFVHTSTRKGVIISNLNEPYYLNTWLSGGEIQ
ncbi:MAG: NlpC/P60 family protein, partial [Bacteroidales bacterium]